MDESSFLFEWSQNKQISVLDLGCGFPKHLISLYEKGIVKKLHGVDHGNEREISIRTTREKGDIKYNFFDVYNSRGHSNKMSADTFQKQIMNSIHFETDIKSYIDNTVDNFDMIICCLSLHFLLKDEFETYVQRILNRFDVDHWSGDLLFLKSVLNKTNLDCDLVVIHKPMPFQFEFQNFNINHP